METHLNASRESSSVSAAAPCAPRLRSPPTRHNGEVTTTPGTYKFGIRRDLTRPDGTEHSDRVTYIELFFDLIFVLALTQLSGYLYDNLTLTGALESAILTLGLWWVWSYTTWVTNLLDPARLPVRAIVISLALCGLVMSTSISESFGDRGIVFAIAYVLIQVVRTIFVMLAVARHNRRVFRDFLRVLVWLAASGVFWLLGAVVPLDFRLLLWLVAIAIEYVSIAVQFRVPGMPGSDVDDWNLSGPHIAERSALFVIIALGESFLVTGFAFVAQESSLLGVIGVLLSFTCAVTMWWLYFDHGERAGARTVERLDEPGRVVRLAYVYVHALIVTGVVLVSVADKEVLGHPQSDISLPIAIVIAGGPLLYLLGLVIFRWVVARELLLSHLIGSALLCLVGALAGIFTVLAMFAAATAILVMVAIWETTVRVRAGGDDLEAG